MKNKMWIWCLSNSLILLFMLMYLGITKDITTKASDRCDKLQDEVEMLDNKFECIYQSLSNKKDTLVINVNNFYNK